jgi:hypothetical protein
MAIPGRVILISYENVILPALRMSALEKSFTKGNYAVLIA